ncbi:HAMP domain-containing histidine kinase [Ancylomarina salipaludis]|uniref:histidine kinase n=1 Tax=Ancylomarina salipaludis TaxID=2501299 RepID=A0A4Q1JK26_9BACT|nr:sensor histidine kinase [Ancylomarina salipaludis]RXQ91535.1 HAMP domain-containing histidine kinase [Ancylomarina salipaludis]
MISRFSKHLSDSINKSRFATALNTVFVFVPVFSIILIVTIFILRTQEKMELKLVRNAEKSLVDTKFKSVESEINHVINDLFILKSETHIKEFLADANPDIFEDLSQDMLNIVKYKKIYDQVRLLDENGMELIRVNYNQGNPIIVSKENLQSKSNRYYFKEAIKLNENEVFISPLDLNIENNQIEQPLKPMIRVATPVFDQEGLKRGILLFNFFGETILSAFDSYSDLMINNKLMLLNAEGYWLKGESAQYEWGFMYEDRKDIKFSNQYKDAWNEMVSKEASQFENKDGLFTFQTIYPLMGRLKSDRSEKTFVSNQSQLLSKSYYWTIVSYVPSEILYFKQNKRRFYVALLLVIISISLFLISWKLAKVKTSRKQALQLLKINNDTKDKFFSIVAHDLKGPFNALLGFSNLLMSEVREEENSNINEYSTIIHSTLKNTYDFLINLLDWSRSQINGIEYKPEAFFLSDLVDEIFALLKLQADKKEIRMNNFVSDQLKIVADKNILSTIIRNIVTNALKYSNSGGDVKVSASIKNHRLLCTISDNGVGIDAENIDKLFHLDSNRSTLGTDDEKGTGLGLILCRELIEKHKGSIGVESEIAKGSDFWFDIPQPLNK